MTESTPSFGIREALSQVVTRRHLTAAEMAAVVGSIMDGQTTPAQVGALLTGLCMKGEVVDEVKQHGHGIRDLNWREIVTVVPLLVFIFWIGLYPDPFFRLMGPSVDKLVAALQTAALAMH